LILGLAAPPPEDCFAFLILPTIKPSWPSKLKILGQSTQTELFNLMVDWLGLDFVDAVCLWRTQMIERTVAALAALRAIDAGPISQGLSSENASACLHQAIRPLNATSLKSAIMASGLQPKSIAIVVPEGVFTTPIEWTAIATAAGCTVHLKAPQSDPGLCRMMSKIFTQEGLQVSWSTERKLPPVDAILAFGGDDTVAAISQHHPHTPVVKYGHRFSIALVTDNADQAAGPLAIDCSRYDGRGCMAPTAVFTTLDSRELMEAMAPMMTLMEQKYPRGLVDDALGPEWRRRIGLARILGQAKTGSEWAITSYPRDYFIPSALPRMVTIHPIKDLDEMRETLRPYQPWLSTLGTDQPDVNVPGIHRICRLGWMQAPSIPRNHDGRLMLSGL
jgi:hypothetical protein